MYSRDTIPSDYAGYLMAQGAGNRYQENLQQAFNAAPGGSTAHVNISERGIAPPNPLSAGLDGQFKLPLYGAPSPRSVHHNARTQEPRLSREIMASPDDFMFSHPSSILEGTPYTKNVFGGTSFARQ